ncbi:MAG: 4Fe-4S binding protein [Dehalococcoidales bacterium]|nr:4Fe-4S binding protein [Dehalococcoidales bacterium]
MTMKLSPFRLALLMGLVTAAFNGWWYSKPYPILGVALGLISGLMIFYILKSGKIERLRRSFFIALATVIALSLAGLIMFWGPTQFMQWVDHFNPGYYFPGTGGIGTLQFPHPLVLPAIFWGGAEFLPSVNAWQTQIPGNLATFALFMVPYAIILLLFGRAYCGWICPLGGLPEAAASGRREFVRLDFLRQKIGINNKFYYGPLKPWINILRYSLVLALVLLSIFLGFSLVNLFYPVLWLKLKAFWLVIGILGIMAIILPILTKRRWFCYICPAGTIINLLDRISPFRLKINQERCVKCLDCVNSCRMFALNPEDVDKGHPQGGSCIKCGRCVEACSEEAIDFYWTDTKFKVRGPFIALAITTALSLYVWYTVLLVSIFSRAGDFYWPG